MKFVAFDMECNGLLHELTKMHCAIVYDYDEGVFYEFTSIQELGEFLSSHPDWMLVCHNCYDFDNRALRKLGLDVKNKWIDTLGLSWYLDLDRPKHKLEGYGEEFGVAKPEVEDWHNLSVEEYLHRNREDTKIQALLWKRQWEKLLYLYKNEKDAMRCVDYINFKMQLLALKSDTKWKIDKPKVEGHISEWCHLVQEKKTALERVMPNVEKKASRNPPKKPYKKNGELSATGLRWKELTEKNNLPFEHEEVIKEVVGYNEPNANSSDQLKSWLFGLGWEPRTFEYKKEEKTDEELAEEKAKNLGRKVSKTKYRAIPQIGIGKGEICKSIVELIDKEPAVKELVGLGVLNHRIAIMKGFIKHERDGYIEAGAGGFTNTLRLKHRSPLANIPAPRTIYGGDIRGSLTCEEGEILLGADIKSLETNVKHHYIKPIDPGLVFLESQEGFCEHLQNAVLAGDITEEDMEWWKECDKKGEWDDKEREKRVSEGRSNGKQTTYSAQYGIGAKAYARDAGCSEAEAQSRLDAYWRHNWSIKEVAKNTIVKKDKSGQKWQWNPVNKLWYWLKEDKDRFSTLVQGTGSYIFDKWAENVILICTENWNVNPKFVADFHDELINRLRDNEKSKDKMREVVEQAMKRVNEELNLNVAMEVDVKFGKRYDEIH